MRPHDASDVDVVIAQRRGSAVRARHRGRRRRRERAARSIGRRTATPRRASSREFGPSLVAVTLRESVSASDNGWSAVLWDATARRVARSQRYDVRLVDRIGGGDSFAAGLIYGTAHGRPPDAGAAVRRRRERAEADDPRRLQPRQRRRSRRARRRRRVRTRSTVASDMTFITDDFLLHGRHGAASSTRDVCRAAADPRLSLPSAAGDIADDRRFANLFEIWLEGDHYKWRAMRANGVRRTLLHRRRTAVREIPRLGAHRAAHAAQSALSLDAPRAAALLRHRRPARRTDGAEQSGRAPTRGSPSADLTTRRHPAALPTSTLRLHDRRSGRSARRITTALAASPLATAVYPDVPPGRRAMRAERRARIQSRGSIALGRRADVDRAARPIFSTRSAQRHDDFHAHGCRLSDHGLEQCPAGAVQRRRRGARFSIASRGGARGRSRRGRAVRRLPDAVLRPPRRGARLDQAAAPRRAAQRQHAHAARRSGATPGFDSIGDWPQVKRSAAYLDRPRRANARCRRSSLYNLNPADNYAFATMIGNFQDGSVAGKIQFGSGWWFLDQKEASSGS